VFHASMNTSTFICTSIALFVAAASQAVTATSSNSDAAAAIAARSRVFTEALARGDARAAAGVFTADARVILSGIGQPISGRSDIEGFWLAAVGGGLKGLELNRRDLEGEGALRYETGMYRVRGAGGAEIGYGHYLLVWKLDAGEWRIHLDVGSAVTTAPATPASAPAAAPAAGAAGAGKTATRLPVDYRALKLLGVQVARAEPSVHTVYANEHAAATFATGRPPFPDGSIIVMEFANAVRDGEGELVRERDGTPMRGEVLHVDVMRRGPGLGAAYGDSRAGEWEFSSYAPDGGVLVAPENGAQCAACHRGAGADKDFVFRAGAAPLAR
jgi:ketosteroid isomerase-like protein